MSESWRTTWRVAAPMLSTEGLEALLKALEEDDPRLLQGSTTDPPPLACIADWPTQKACLLALPCVTDLGGFGTATVAETEQAFGALCQAIDAQLGEPGGIRWLLNPYDSWSREEMRRCLIPEVKAELARRKEQAL